MHSCLLPVQKYRLIEKVKLHIDIIATYHPKDGNYSKFHMT